jgi:CheY-like chemotaxis protein
VAARTGAILIIEDFVDDAEDLQTVLKQAAVYNPAEVVHSVTDAISHLTYVTRCNDPDRHPPVKIILLDLKLPGLDGFQFLEWLRVHPEFGDMLVVVVSGLDDLASIRRAYALGADSFLIKPCKVADLESIMRSFPEYWERGAAVYPAVAPRPATAR